MSKQQVQIGWWLGVAGCMALALCMPALGQNKGTKGAKEAPPTFVVFLQKKDLKDLGAYKAMGTAEAKEYYVGLKKEYAEASKAWSKEKSGFYKDRANKGKRFNTPKPSMPIIRMIRQSIKSQELAEKMASAYQQKLDARSKKAKGKTAT